MKDDLIDLVVGAVGRLIGTLISSLAGIGFVKKLCDLMLGIAKLCKDLGEMVQAFAESLIDLAQGGSGVIGRIAERMQGVLTKAIRPLMTILLAGIGLQGLVTKVKGLFSKIAEAIGKVVMKAWKALFTLIKKIFGGGKPGPEADGKCKIGKKNRSPAGQSGALGPNPQEGDRNFEVRDPDTGNIITDIDHIQNGVLWEEKSAVFAGNIAKWVDKQIKSKFASYLKARQFMCGFENAPIGFRFTAGKPVDARFANAIVAAIDELRSANPDVDIRLEW